MLNIKTFIFNNFQVNTYLITNNKNQCWIIDPGMFHFQEKKQFISFLDENKLEPQAILCTHTHLDHVFGVQALIEKYNIPFGIHKTDLQVLDYASSSAAMFGIDFDNAPHPTFYIEESNSFKLEDESIEILHCPGHSTGSIVFYYQKGGWAIVGDVLFEGSIGRTDLPGGSFDTLMNSIKNKLFKLPDDTIVYSGHGESTTIMEEKMHNPFCRVV